MWLMTQQDVPDDYVVATGKSHSLKTFVEKVFSRFGLNFSQHVHIEKNYLEKMRLSIVMQTQEKHLKNLTGKH